MLALSPCLWWSPSPPPPCGASQAGLLCGRAAVAAGRSPLAVRRPFLTSKQAAAQKIKRLRRALPWSTPCGAGWNGRKKFLMGVPSTNCAAFRCWIQEFFLVNRSITGSSACRSFACVHVQLAVHRGAVVLQSCPVVPVPLCGRPPCPAASCRCARCFDRFLLTRAPVPKIFGACGGHCHGAHLVVRAGTAEKVSYGCTKYESAVDTGVLLLFANAR